jgi:hypothetical protein
MITTCELTEQIDRMTQSKEAVTEFARRMAVAFEQALEERLDAYPVQHYLARAAGMRAYPVVL